MVARVDVVVGVATALPGAGVEDVLWAGVAGTTVDFETSAVSAVASSVVGFTLGAIGVEVEVVPVAAECVGCIDAI